MKKILMGSFLVVMLLFVNACGQGDKGTQSGGSTVSEQDRLLENREVLEAELAALNPVDWTELTCYADTETSLRNSNFLNYGYLTYDEEGHIYFYNTNNENSGIFMSSAKGDDLKKISDDTGLYLQFEDGWLYYQGSENGIKRLEPASGETEWIYQEPCGEFVLVDKRIYINTEDGLCQINLDGSGKEILDRSANIDITCFTEGNGWWFGNAINDTDASWFVNGYLVAYEEESGEISFIKEDALYPLLAGNWLSVFVSGTESRHVWNLETGEDTDLLVYAQRIASDGRNLYYANKKDSFVKILKWDGASSEEIWKVDCVDMDYMYLTPDALYCMPSVLVDNKQVKQLWYYDLKTGETGMIY